MGRHVDNNTHADANGYQDGVNGNGTNEEGNALGSEELHDGG